MSEAKAIIVRQPGDLSDYDEIEFTRTALVFHRPLTFERWQELGNALRTMESGMQWWLGDWLNEGERAYGEKYAQAIEETGHTYGTLAIFASVAKNVKPLIRIKDLSFYHHQIVAPLPSDKQEQWLKRATEKEWSVRDLRRAIRLNVLMSSESPEWYTPPKIIKRVVWLLGAIDLDPCSNDHDSPNVSARQHFTIDDDGLAQEWHGRVYMNPPYGNVIQQWAEKLYQEFKVGRVTQAIALLPARVDTGWFRVLRDFPVCFIAGRLKFSGHENSAPFPSAVVALGCDLERFIEAFGDIGDIYVRVQDGGIRLSGTT